MKKTICIFISCAVLVMALTGCGFFQNMELAISTFLSEDHFGGPYTVSMSGSDYMRNMDDSVLVDGPLKLTQVDGPLYDGVEKYVDTGMSFFVRAPETKTNHTVSVSSSNQAVVKAECSLRGEDWNRMLLEFRDAGEATVTFTVEETGEEVSYDITVRKYYDCNPGKNELSTSEFVEYFTKIAEANGMQPSDEATDVQVYASFERFQLTWTQARKLAENCASEWWLNGYRTFYFYYGGRTADGEHMFYACLG